MTALNSTTGAKAAVASARPKPRRRGLSDRAIINLFIWPTLILLIAWNVFPLFYSLFLSFTNYSAIVRQPPEWVGMENYRNILNNPQMWKYFATTGRFALVSVGTQTLLLSLSPRPTCQRHPPISSMVLWVKRCRRSPGTFRPARSLPRP